MLIDWFTVGAQVVNFLILVVLLKKFLYGPILSAMDRREKRLADGAAEAEARVHEAGELEERYRKLLGEAEQERRVRIRQLQDEVEARRGELLAAAHEEVAGLRQAWIAGMRDERETFFSQLRSRVSEELLRVVRKSLGELTGVELEQLLVAVFCERLAELAPEQAERLVSVARQRGVLVRGPTALSEELLRQLEQGVRRVLGSEVAMEYQPHRAMGPGVELVAGELKVSWGVDGYCDQLEEAVAAIYDGQAAIMAETER